MILQSIVTYLEQLAPARLAEQWDNVGLLVGNPQSGVDRVMTCLTVTPASAAEAIAGRAELIVSHHPFPFHALKRITTETPAGSLLLKLIAAGVAVCSPHTAFDSAREGINQSLAEGIGLRGVTPLVPAEGGAGTGRWGWLREELPVETLTQRVGQLLGIEHVQVVGRPERVVRTVGIACGAAEDLLPVAAQLGCDCLLVGEVRFHSALLAEALEMTLILPGHFASERFAVERLAKDLASQFPALTTWASRDEQDPFRLLRVT